jgi:hypothetical protein
MAEWKKRRCNILVTSERARICGGGVARVEKWSDIVEAAESVVWSPITPGCTERSSIYAS